MDNTQINSHDKFFKSLFSGKEEVKEFISKVFPIELSKNINLDSLELDTTEYIDEKLKTNFSDIVYNCDYGKNAKIKISLLFEHKSYTEAYPHFQLMGYMQSIWKNQIKQQQELTPVVPIIFYHGKQKWHKKLFSEYFKATDDVLQQFIPKFDYVLIDTSKYTAKQIKQLFDNLQLQIGLLIMKNTNGQYKMKETVLIGLNFIIQQMKTIF